MKTFTDLPTAFAYVRSSLLSKQRGFLVNVVGPLEELANHAATVQVVDENKVFKNGQFGFALYLPFDPESDTQASYERFRDYEKAIEFELMPTEDGIPCFVMRFGEDIDGLLETLGEVLHSVFEYPTLTAFKCNVYEG